MRAADDGPASGIRQTQADNGRFFAVGFNPGYRLVQTSRRDKHGRASSADQVDNFKKIHRFVIGGVDHSRLCQGPFMRHWDQAKKPRARIEIIPMIDVMMFLLVFFVLISINVIPALGVKTSLPTSSETQDLKTVINAIVTMGKDGELQLNGKPTTLEGLTPGIRAMERPDAKVTIIINGDKTVEMQRLLDVMDALKGGGFESMSIAAKKK